MKDAPGGPRPQARDSTSGEERGRRAARQTRISPDAQGTGGLSLDVQPAVIEK